VTLEKLFFFFGLGFLYKLKELEKNSIFKEYVFELYGRDLPLFGVLGYC
jgi:hypothetical protein